MNRHADTILVVDDETVVRKLLTTTLKAEGFICLEAGSAKEALAQMKNCAVTVVLLDINMPGGSGIELLNELGAAYPDTAVLMISAVSNSDTAIACMRQGAYDYIIKPFNAHEVTMRIEHALEKRKLRIDNTEYRKRLEIIVGQQAGALRASEQNFRNSLENSPLGIRIVTAEGLTIYANRALLNSYGYSTLQEMNADTYKTNHTQDAPPANVESAKRITGGPQASQYEIDVVQKNGDIRRLLVNRAEVLWNGERQFQMLYQDITERVRAEKALRESFDKLDKTLSAVIQTMALVVEMRDPYTSGHQHRVSLLACAIAREMGLSDAQIDGIRVIGSLHDIGKITVPGEILSKPGKITDAEFSIIREHPRTGYDILKGIDFPWPVAQSVLQHHERIDGSGYPNHISGGDITTEARVIAVADVVEAMSSHRPYRPSLGIEQALEEIAAKKGTIYDAVVVNACLKIFREQHFKLE